jgi:hypothetical protein
MLLACVEDVELIAMRVTVELTADDSVESINHSSELLRPVAEAAAASTQNVRQDVNLLTCCFCNKQRVMEPLQLFCNLIATVHYPEVVACAVVVVQSNHSKTGEARNDVSVVAAATNGCLC